MLRSRIFNFANTCMSFNVFRENKILTNIFEFAVTTIITWTTCSRNSMQFYKRTVDCMKERHFDTCFCFVDLHICRMCFVPCIQGIYF